MEITVGGTRIRAERGDLTTLEVDAVVNAANQHLMHGGGLAGALVRAGGDVIQQESDRWVDDHGPLSPGTAAVTGSGRLPCRAVIHVAGPVYRDGQDNEGLLRSTVQAALDAAVDHGFSTIALPAISAGIFGYPMPEATRVIASEAAAWAAAHPDDLSDIRLVGFGDDVVGGFGTGLEAAGRGPAGSSGSIDPTRSA
jgi:O-acetyl-ADP-ribose deacetylase (regulator of RNase III)